MKIPLRDIAFVVTLSSSDGRIISRFQLFFGTQAIVKRLHYFHIVYIHLFIDLLYVSFYFQK